MICVKQAQTNNKKAMGAKKQNKGWPHNHHACYKYGKRGHLWTNYQGHIQLVETGGRSDLNIRVFE